MTAQHIHSQRRFGITEVQFHVPSLLVQYFQIHLFVTLWTARCSHQYFAFHVLAVADAQLPHARIISCRVVIDLTEPTRFHFRFGLDDQVIMGTQRFTFAEINRWRARQYAPVLAQTGLRPEPCLLMNQSSIAFWHDRSALIAWDRNIDKVSVGV